MTDEQQMMPPEEQRRKIEKALRQIRAGLRMLMRTNTEIDEFYAVSLLISRYINYTFPKTAETKHSASKSAITE